MRKLLFFALLLIPLKGHTFELWEFKGFQVFLPVEPNLTALFDFQKDRVLSGAEADIFQFKRLYGTFGVGAEFVGSNKQRIKGSPYIGLDYDIGPFFGLDYVRSGLFYLRDWENGENRTGVKVNIEVFNFLFEREP